MRDDPMHFRALSLRLLGVPVESDVLPGQRPGLHEQREVARSSFQRPGLDTSGTQTDPLLRHHGQQGRQVGRRGEDVAILLPQSPQLHGVLEAELAGDLVGQQRRLRHQQTDQVVGKQVDPDFFLDHRGTFAGELVHPEGGFDVPQVEFDAPAPPVEGVDRRLRILFGVQQRRHQDLAASGQLTHRQGGRHAGVVGRSHPVGALGPSQHEEVIARAKQLTRREICATATGAKLLEDPVDTGRNQRAQQEIGRKEGVAHQDIARLQVRGEFAQQGLLVAALPLTGSDCRITQGRASQVDQTDHPAVRKPQPRRLGGGLRPTNLVGQGVGHRHDRAIDQPHPATLPPPVVRNRVRHQRAGLAGQRPGHVRRQTLARLTIAAGVALAPRQIVGHPVERFGIDGFLARAVRRQRLGAEHRQHLHRWKQAVAMGWGQRLGALQQLRAGQQVEENVSIGLLRAVLDMPLNGAGLWSAMHRSWPLGWQVVRSQATAYHPRRSAPCFSFFSDSCA